MYETIASLPAAVRERMSPEAQALWMRVYNRSVGELGEESAEDAAWTAVSAAGLPVDIEKADATVAQYMESRIHRDFTMEADEMYGAGRIDRNQRIVMSNAIGDALDAFRMRVQSSAPELYSVALWGDDEIVKADFDAVGVIQKRDDEKRLVFGYALFSEDPETRGTLHADRQGDMIETEDVEVAAYDYVQKSRDSGAMHRGEGGKATLVESVVFTPEKLEAMGLPGDSVPDGAWWIGMKVSDDDTWDRVKSGEFSAFSIDGSAVRKKVSG